MYAAIFHSGNRTTTVNEGAVCDGGAPAGPCPSAAAPRRAACRRRTSTRRRAAAGGRADRPPQRRNWVDELGRELETASCASACPTRTCSRSTPTPVRRASVAAVRPRRHGAFQHGGESRDRAALRAQHRGPEPGALRGHPAGHRDRAAPSRPCSGHQHESRITVIDPGGLGAAPAPQQAHQLRGLAGAGRRAGAQPRAAAGDRGQRRRRRDLPRGAGLRQGGVSSDAAQSRTTPSAELRPTTSP